MLLCLVCCAVAGTLHNTVMRALDVRAQCCAGWFNLLGQAAVTAGIDFALASHIQGMWVLSNGYVLSQKELLAVYASKPWPLLSCSKHQRGVCIEGTCRLTKAWTEMPSWQPRRRCM